jgi:hypothetical protein
MPALATMLSRQLSPDTLAKMSRDELRTEASRLRGHGFAGKLSAAPGMAQKPASHPSLSTSTFRTRGKKSASKDCCKHGLIRKLSKCCKNQAQQPEAASVTR